MLPPPGADLAVVGCGTSWFVAQAYTAAREAAGQGRSDPFTASEFPHARTYSHVLAISRSGTTSEVEALLRELPGEHDLDRDHRRRRLAVRAGCDAPRAARLRRRGSVVQTRFATTALALLRAALGHDVAAAAAHAERALTMPLPLDPSAIEQISFLGAAGPSAWPTRRRSSAARRPSCGPRRTRPWSTVTDPSASRSRGRAVWPFGPLPPGLADQIHATGATLVDARPRPHGLARRWHSGSPWPPPRRAASTPTCRATSPVRSSCRRTR